MADFEIKTFDLLPTFRVPLTIGGQPLDLTLALSADFILRSAVPPGGTVIVNRPAVIESPKTAGIIHYDWVAGDTDVSGDFFAEFEIHWPSTKPQSAPTNAYWTVHIGYDLDGAA